MMAPDFPVERALRLICTQHRHLSIVMGALNTDIAAVASNCMPPDYPRIRAMLHYIELVAEGVHHPAEEACLFPAMQQRRAPPEIIETVIADHQGARGALRSIQLAFGDASHLHDVPGSELPALVEAYVASQHDHMRFEEDTVLPCAVEILLPRDWPRIADEFNAHADPVFGTAPVGEFAALQYLATLHGEPQ